MSAPRPVIASGRDHVASPTLAILGAATALAIATTLAYSNSFSGPLVFDDIPSITENASLRSWAPFWAPLIPQHGSGITVDGRPVLNLSLAINYAFGGTSVTGYHVVNLLIHLAAALVLFGLIRRTLLLPRLRAQFGAHATSIGFATALLWSLHPLQTESVTYVIQRAESLVSLFYLLTLYCFCRGASAEAPTRWLILGTFACLCGMGAKEIMVSAPLLVLLYDRALVSGTFARAWSNHRRWYLALGATYVLLGTLVYIAGNRGGTAGVGIDVTWWKYGLTQLVSLTRYIGLSLWPHPLVFDYGTEWITSPAQLVPAGALILGLGGATVRAFWKNSPLAVPALLFFAILAPTSSILPGNRQTMAEHRMYLPLAAVVLLSVVAVHRGRSTPPQRPAHASAVSSRSLRVALLMVATAFGWLTFERNQDYRSEYILYADTVAKRPDNHFARYNLAKNLAESGRAADALVHYEAAIRLRPGMAYIHYNYANALAELQRFDAAVAQYETAIRLEPQYVNAHFNLGNALIRMGNAPRAAEAFTAVLKLQPGHLEARENLGSVWFDMGRLADARAMYEAVVRAAPRAAMVRVNLGNVLWLLGDVAGARAQLAEALRIDPGFEPARASLARMENESAPRR